MKVTALLPDPLIRKVKRYAGGKNLTESLVVALKDWVAHKKIIELNRKIEKSPFSFKKGFSAEKARKVNRSLS